MKYLRKISKIITGLFLASLLVSSCTKDFEELNTNPNNPEDVPAITLLTNVQVNGVNRQLGDWMQSYYLGNWSQQWSKVQYIDEDRYQVRDMSAYMNGAYTSELKNLQIILTKTEKNGELGLNAAAKVMRAWVYMYLTDIWGDIPYSDALQGFELTGSLTPKYDSQAAIYADLLAKLEEANITLAGESESFGSGDLFFGGDPAEWRKFANSLKLRLLNRAAGTPWSFTYNMKDPQADVTTNPGTAAMSDADTRIAAILANPTQYPIMTSNDDNVFLEYPGLPYRNPIFNGLYTRTDCAISETMVDWLKSRVDPRLHIYGQPTPNSINGNKALPVDTIAYVGFQNGRNITAASFPAISLLGTSVGYNENAPLYVITYDEVLFIIAEHQMRRNNDAAAKVAYENGIIASFERWGLNDGSNVYPSWGKTDITESKAGIAVDFESYIGGPLVAWGGTAAQKFQKINEQKWAAMFGEGVQAYSEVRRSGFPERVFEYELEGAYYKNLGLPIRIQYALSEDTYNTSNVSEARTRQNIELTNEGMFSTDGTKAQVWWHTRKNPIPTETDVR